jgi:hypothetical protein
MTVVLDNIIKLAALQEAAKPELIVNVSDPTATAIELAALFAAREDFLFNGYSPVRVAAETDNLPRAIEVTTEAAAGCALRPVVIDHMSAGHAKLVFASHELAS